MTQQSNFRLPTYTNEQIERLVIETGMTRTQIIILAIDRLNQQLYGYNPEAPQDLYNKLDEQIANQD